MGAWTHSSIPLSRISSSLPLKSGLPSSSPQSSVPVVWRCLFYGYGCGLQGGLSQNSLAGDGTSLKATRRSRRPCSFRPFSTRSPAPPGTSPSVPYCVLLLHAPLYRYFRALTQHAALPLAGDSLAQWSSGWLLPRCYTAARCSCTAVYHNALHCSLQCSSHMPMCTP